MVIFFAAFQKPPPILQIAAECSVHIPGLGEHIAIPAHQCPSLCRHEESVQLQLLPRKVSSPQTYLPLMKKNMLLEHKLKVVPGKSMGTAGAGLGEERAQ